MELLSAANFFLKLRDDLTVSARQKRLFSELSNFFKFQPEKNRWNFKIFFSKLVHRKGCFGKIKKNSIFRH